MIFHFRTPSINSTSIPGQISQIRTHLFNLTHDLNYAFSQLGSVQSADANESEKPTSTGDAVIKEGKHGIWTYRRWASGRSEAWGEKTISMIPVQTATGNGSYYADIDSFGAFPDGLFSEAPTITATVSGSGGFWMMVKSASVPTMKICSVGAGLADGNKIYCYAVGKWN